MEHLEDIFHRNGRIYDGTAQSVNDFFEWAIENNEEETAKALIFPGSPVLTAEINPDNDSFLHLLAMDGGRIVTVQLLLDFGLNIDKQNCSGETALHFAAHYGFTNDEEYNITKVLLKNGANENIRNNDGLTPFEMSLYSGNLETAEEFLKAANKIPNVDDVDTTKRCWNLVKCLLEERKDWNIRGSNYSILLDFLVTEEYEIFEYALNNSEFDPNALNIDGHTLLHRCADVYDSDREIRALIKAGADPNAENKSFETPLFTAIKKTQIENFHCLLDCGADVNKVQKYKEETNSPLQYAACAQNLKMVEKLLELGADVNALSLYRSPLLLACCNMFSKKCAPISVEVDVLYLYSNNNRRDDNAKIVKVLLDHGADLKAKNAMNRTALDQACRFGKLDVVKLLLNRGAKINQGDVSTLHHAVRGQDKNVVELILKRGAHVNYRCAPEKWLKERPADYVEPPPRTPLECALNFIHEDIICSEIVQLLLDYGGDINASNPVGKDTPLHLACLCNKNNNFLLHQSHTRALTIKRLLSHNADVNALNNQGLVPLHFALRNFTLTINANSNRDSFKLLSLDLAALIAFIAKRIANKERVIEQNHKLLENASARLIYDECVNELNLMKQNICETRNFSYQRILFKDIHNVSMALENKDIREGLTKGEFMKKFPIYALFLGLHILKSLDRQKVFHLGINVFKYFVTKKIPLELILSIFGYLNCKDIRNLIKAYIANIDITDF